jgi:hypothetical protein
MPFQGLLASQLVCMTCSGRTPVKHDPFSSISLPFSANNPVFPSATVPLVSLLRSFFASDSVEGVNCAKCTQRAREFLESNDGRAVEGAGEGAREKKHSIKRTFIKDTFIGKVSTRYSNRTFLWRHCGKNTVR